MQQPSPDTTADWRAGACPDWHTRSTYPPDGTIELAQFDQEVAARPDIPLTTERVICRMEYRVAC
jgi:hypothetical protein